MTAQAAGPDEAQVVAGRYLLRGEVAAGGMAVVHRALDQSTGRTIALKRLRADAPGAAATLFRREYHTLAQLKHPRIIEVYDYGVDGGAFYTMELLDGRDLGDLAPLPVEEAIRHLRDVASSLALLHARRLLHRDVSPRNVRITSNGRAKLIDFGAMATFGADSHIVGTPVGVPPEALHGLELDQRSDLFSFGALAYLVLTGRHAYPARTMQALPMMWRTTTPAPPSELARDIPPELDDLVRALLSLDAMARPSSAAEVIARLDAILPPEEEDGEEVSAAYLANPRLVGRKRELGRLAALVEGLQDGKSFGMVVHGGPGVGKSRLLGEAILQAQLAGCRVLRLDAERHRGPQGTTRGVLQALAAHEPETFTTLARPHASVLGHLYPPLLEATGTALVQLPKDRSERANVVQKHLVELLSSFCESQPMVFGVDNAHASDTPSLSTLLRLAQEARGGSVGVWFVLREGESGAAALLEGKLGNLPRMPLEGLDVEGSGALVRALFGAADYAERMGKWLFEATGGNPGHSLALAQRLVDAGRVHYQDGSWVLPAEQPAELAEADLSQLHESRLTGLGADARVMLDGLSVERNPVPLRRCIDIAELPTDRALAALGELSSRGLLVTGGDEYRFTHQSLREHVAAQLAPDRRRALHQRVGELTLAAGAEDLPVKIEAGFHLLRGTTPMRGAELLDDAGMALVTTVEGLRFAGPGLEAALDVYERERRSAWAVFPLLDALTSAGWYVDYRYADRYGERTLALGLELSGLSLADKLSRVVGDQIALKIGTATAMARHSRQKKHIRHASRRSFRGVFSPLVGSVGIMVGVAANTFNGAEARRVLRKARMFSVFEDGHVLSVMYDYARYFTLASEGRFGEAEPIAPRVLEWFESPTGIKALTPEGSKALAGGIMTGMVSFQSLRDDVDIAPWAARLEALGLTFYVGMAVQARFCAAMRRGHAQEARAFRKQLERIAVQGGTTWQSSLIIPLISAGAAARAGDLVELRQWTEAMSRLAAKVPVLGHYATVYRAQLALLRGQPKRALEMLDSVREETGPHRWMEWALTQATRARALTGLGDTDGALEVVEAARAVFHPSDAPYVYGTLDVDLAEVDTRRVAGEFDRAAALCDGLLDRHGAHGSPLTMCLLREARARIALATDDRGRVEQERLAIEQLARDADNSTLLAKAKHLERAAQRRFGGGTGAKADGVERSNTDMELLRSELSATPPPDRPATALQLIIDRTGAAAGHLYLRQGDELLPAVDIPAYEEPPRALTQQLQALLQQATAGDDDDDVTRTASVDEVAQKSLTEAIRAQDGLDVRLLFSTDDGAPGIMGAVALRRGGGSLDPLPTGVLAVIAAALAPPRDSGVRSPRTERPAREAGGK